MLNRMVVMASWGKKSKMNVYACERKKGKIPSNPVKRIFFSSRWRKERESSNCKIYIPLPGDVASALPGYTEESTA